MITISLDGYHYLRMASGQPTPSPYSRRRLLPWLLGPHPHRWAALTYASLLATPAVAWCYFGAIGFVGWSRAFAAALLCALPGVWRVSLRLPVLTDAPAFVLALGVAALAPAHPYLAALLSLPLGAIRETSPIFAALWAWHPAPLLGLLGARWFAPSCPPNEAREPWLAHPFREAWAMRRRIGLDPSLYLRPWGVALLGLVGAPSWQMVATVALAHAQLFVAQDAIRLAVWCAPVLVARAAPMVPAAWWALAILVTALQKDDRV